MAESMTNLRVASFRGVEFNVTETDHTTGRRVVVHEYPERDTPFTEDMGRAAKSFTVKGFFVGQDYIAKMKALEEKLETRGAGELIHPWLGRLLVVLHSANVHFSQKLLRVDFDLTFSESGAQTYPSKGADIAYQTRECAAVVQSCAVAALLKKLKLSSMQDFVARSIVSNIDKALGIDSIAAINQLFDVSEAITDFMSDALALMGKSPAGFGEALAGALGLSRYATVTAAWRSVARSVSKLVDDDELNTRSSVMYGDGTQSHTVARATEAYHDLIRQVEVANAVLAVANVGTDLDKPGDGTLGAPLAYDDLIELRDGLLSTIDREALKTDDDDLYQALRDARSAVWENLTTKAESQARLVTYTPSAVMPAVVVAYEFYEDANRDLEIVERNDIVRPGFVPVAPLKLLSE